MKEYIILEIIPSTSKRETGNILQIQALKLNDLKLLDRFDYRLDIPINNPDLLNMISYDKENFTYVKDEKKLIKCYEELVHVIEDNPKSKDLKTLKDYVKKYENNDLKIVSIRTYYNKYTLQYNNMIKKFPYNIISKIKKLKIRNIIEGKELDINFNNDLEV